LDRCGIARSGAPHRTRDEGRIGDAVATIGASHDALCRTPLLDPACGTGNFLDVSLELLKRLEGEVLEALANLGGQDLAPTPPLAPGETGW
jgi:hypothetical protein